MEGLGKYILHIDVSLKTEEIVSDPRHKFRWATFWSKAHNTNRTTRQHADQIGKYWILITENDISDEAYRVNMAGKWIFEDRNRFPITDHTEQSYKNEQHDS